MAAADCPKGAMADHLDGRRRTTISVATEIKITLQQLTLVRDPWNGVVDKR